MTSFGSRPNTGRESSLSVDGQTMHSTTPLHKSKKTYKYRRVANSGSVDETLFSSHRDDYLRSASNARPSSNTRPGSVGGRSEWIVHGEQNHSPVETPKRISLTTPPIKSPLIGVGEPPRTRSRMYKHTPSYVDEMLFGPKLKEPDFAAPWEKPQDKRKGPVLIWSPPVAGSLSCPPTSSRSAVGGGSRPGSAQGRQSGSASRNGKRPATPSKPVWK